MPTAVATAVEAVTKSQSGVLVRNLFRLNVSEILHGLGCFEEQDFELREVHGSRVHSLGNPQIESSERAKAMIKWIEKGVFGASARPSLFLALPHTQLQTPAGMGWSCACRRSLCHPHSYGRAQAARLDQS